MHPIQPRNFFDRCIEAIAPKYAASRYSSRAQIALARSIPESSYRGAVATRSSTPWSPFISYRGGSAVDRNDLASIANRAARVYRDNPIGRGLLNAEVDNIVAEGFSLQMRTLSDEFNKEAEKRFYRWLETADVAGKLCAADWFRTSWREPRKSGDGGIILIMRGGYPKLQYIPRDLICNPRKEYDSKTMFDGVECDPSGRAIRFWLRDVDETGKDTVSPIDARDFVYLSHLDNPLAVRGVSVFAPVFALLDQLDSYVDAVTKAAIMAAIFGLIEKRRNPAAAVSALGTLTNSQGDQQKAVTLENGMLKVMGTDETMFQVQASQPMQQTPDFIRALMRLICLAFDMPIEIGQKDLSQVNFSGGRIGLIGYYRSCRVKQDWLLSRCWNRIAFWWLSVEKQRQAIGYPDAFKAPFPADYGEFEFHGREWDYNDPQTEIVADMIEMDAGIASPQQVCEKRGRDWHTIQDQISESRRVADSLGIPMLHSINTREETPEKA
jgi:capsid protein